MSTASDGTGAPAVDITVVVATYNRAARLQRLLESIFAQRGEVAFELIVVDNNSSDDTAQVVARMLASAPVPMRYLFEPRQGRSFGINRAIDEARGAICAPFDDDQIVPPLYLQQLADAFRAYPDAAFIGGKVLGDWEAPPPDWLTPDLWSPLGLADYGDRAFAVHRDRLLTLITCAFRTDALRAIGGFDTRMRRSQDAEILKRLVRHGATGMYVPELQLLHAVPAHRLTKAHYRHWYRRNGRYMAVEQDPEFEHSRFQLGGIPAHVLRQLVRESWVWLRRLPRDRNQAFVHETRMQLLAGFLGERWRQRRRDPGERAGSPAGRVVSP